MNVHIFGEHDEWAISEDDGCLRFHPRWGSKPEIIGKWIWRQAWDEVERLGGFDETIRIIRQGGLPSAADVKGILAPAQDRQTHD